MSAKICLVTSLLILVFAVPAGAAVVKSYEIDVTFEPAAARMSATAKIDFVPGSVTGSELFFFLHGELAVDSVVVDGKRVNVAQEQVYHRDDYSLIATRAVLKTDGLDVTRGISVVYSGQMNPSVAAAQSNYMRIDAGGVYLRSLGYSLWFPVFVDSWRKSHKVAFSRVTVRTPEQFTAVFAGERVRETVRDGFRVSEWTAGRLELFAAQCTARPYEVLVDGGFHVYYTPDPVSKQKAAEILAFSQRLESMYKSDYRRGVSGGQLHIMQMPRYGDISSGNVIGISDAVWNRFEVTDWQGQTVAHELVHPFVRTPCTEELAAFVIEGFPSFFHLPALAEILGEDWYREYLKQVETAYLRRRETGKSRRGTPLPPEKPILEIKAAEIGTYKDTFVLNDRVRLFFDYIRRRLGNEQFFRFSSDLLNKDKLDYATVVSVVEFYLPGSGGDVYTWLKTTDFPAGFRIDGP